MLAYLSLMNHSCDFINWGIRDFLYLLHDIIMNRITVMHDASPLIYYWLPECLCLVTSRVYSYTIVLQV